MTFAPLPRGCLRCTALPAAVHSAWTRFLPGYLRCRAYRAGLGSTDHCAALFSRVLFAFTCRAFHYRFTAHCRLVPARCRGLHTRCTALLPGTSYLPFLSPSHPPHLPLGPRVPRMPPTYIWILPGTTPTAHTPPSGYTHTPMPCPQDRHIGITCPVPPWDTAHPPHLPHATPHTHHTHTHFPLLNDPTLTYSFAHFGGQVGSGPAGL